MISTNKIDEMLLQGQKLQIVKKGGGNALLLITLLIPVSPRTQPKDRGWLLTVSGFLLIHAFILILRVNVFCLSDPVQVAFEVLFQLLLLPQLLEISSSFGLLPLFGKLSGDRGGG